MSVRFRPLLRLEVGHDYDGGRYRDVEFVLPPDTRSRMSRARLLARTLDGVLHIAYQTGSGDAPLVPFDGLVLRVGLRATDAAFAGYTALPNGFPAVRPIYTNFDDVNALSAEPAGGVTLLTRMLTWPVTGTARPVAVTVRDAEGEVVAVREVGRADERSVTMDLEGRESGMVEVTQEGPGGASTANYYLDPFLVQQDAFAVVELLLDAAHATTPPNFRIQYTTRAERLSYYVVVRNHTEQFFTDLAVSDAGFNREGRPRIQFTRVPASAFGAGELPVTTFAKPDDRVVLFRSNGPVARRRRARAGIQLTRDDDVLIPNLPQPGPDRSNGDMIVHLIRP